jgi:hypothetical protein
MPSANSLGPEFGSSGHDAQANADLPHMKKADHGKINDIKGDPGQEGIGIAARLVIDGAAHPAAQGHAKGGEQVLAGDPPASLVAGKQQPDDQGVAGHDAGEA